MHVLPKENIIHVTCWPYNCLLSHKPTISRWYKPKSGSIMYKNPWEIVGGYTLNPWPGVRVCQGLKKLTPTLTPAYPTQNPCGFLNPWQSLRIHPSHHILSGCFEKKTSRSLSWPVWRAGYPVFLRIHSHPAKQMMKSGWYPMPVEEMSVIF